MPRNACKECRSRKIKCIVNQPNQKCERCMDRRLDCSYVPEKPVEASRSSMSSSRPIQPLKPSAYANGDPPISSRYRLTQDVPTLDIGTGTPAGILREGEFCQSLLLLYFSNFSDVHFMFDEELFLRQYALGEAPPMLLYGMMALSIRYSHAPFEDAVSPSHRGELLYDQTRNLMKETFDEPSLTTIQAYVLLSTYKLTFGGARQASIFLGYAVGLIKALRLFNSSEEVDPLRLELNRRLIGTVALLDRITSPALNFPLHLVSMQDSIPSIRSDEDFGALKNRTYARNDFNSASVAQEILKLSSILSTVVQSYRADDSFTVLSQQELEYRQYAASLDSSLAWTENNLERHQNRDSLRRFSYMHILYHHVGQLIYFKSLSRVSDNRFNREDIGNQVSKCHHHSRAIAEIVEYNWATSGFDLHNGSMGQILTVATVVHTHALVMCQSMAETEQVRARIETIRACVNRVKRQCRMFMWVSRQLESFLRLCDQTSRPLNEIFDRDPALLGQMLHLGSHFERLDYRTAGKKQGLEALLQIVPGSEQSPFSTGSDMSPVSTHRPPASGIRQPPVPRSTGPVDISAQNWQLDDLAWAFYDSSLPQLHSLPNA